MTHRLLLMRHAKSDHPPGVEDHDRPLAERGRQDAKAAGDLLAARRWAPDLVLCSTAERTRETWAVAGAELVPAPVLLEEPALYEAAPQDVLRLVRSAGEGVETLLVLGHNPSIEETAATLAGAGSDPDALARLETFATAGVAAFSLDVPWADLGPGGAALEAFETPRG
jgi:phosphohistidine phosphatase